MSTLDLAGQEDILAVRLLEGKEKIIVKLQHMVCSAAEVRSAVSSVKFLLTLPSILSDGQVLRGFAQSHFNADLLKLVQCCLFVELSVRLHPLFIECFILADIASCLSSYWPAELVAHLHIGQHSLLPIPLALKHEHNDRKTVFFCDRGLKTCLFQVQQFQFLAK